MNPLRRYPVLASVLSPFRLSQQKSCAALVAALCQASQASSFAISGQLSCLTEVQFGSALTRLYRFLRNERFTKAEFVERMYLLVGLALLLWTAVGRAVEVAEPKVRLRSKRKGARLSLARIGSYYWRKATRQLTLTTRFVRAHLPPPQLRVFKWLTATQK